MSRIHYRDYSLKEACRRSGYIVMGTPEKPFSSKEEVIVELHDTDKTIPYTLTRYHYQVNEVLKGEVKKDESILVVSANIGSRMKLRAMDILQGIRKSPIYKRYVTQRV